MQAPSQADYVLPTANVRSVGNSGKYNFELHNSGDRDVTVAAFGIRATSNPNAVEVADGDILREDRYGSVVDRPIPIDSSDPDSATMRSLDPEVAIPAGRSGRFKLRHFVTADGKKAKMKKNGDRVEIRVRFVDPPTTADYTLEP